MATSPLSKTRFKLIFSVSWIVAFLDVAFVLKWFGLPWKAAFVDSSISITLLLLFALLIMNTLRFYTPRRERYINILVWCLFLMAIWLTITRWLLSLSNWDYPGYEVFLKNSLPIRGSIGLLIMGCISLISVIWYTSEEQKESDQRKTDAEKLAREAELFKLRQQLQPHFLFNSLNSINALIGSRPQEARKMIQQLSDFLRGTLRKEEHQWVSLREEIQYLELYLDIEKVRFANRLSTIIEINPAAEQMKLPALLLQPIVENAIKFGLYDTTGDAVIRIKSDRDEKSLLIRVENPFDPETASSKTGTGFGLRSVQRRLYLIFGRQDLLTTETKENTFITIVKIPQHE